MKSIKLHSFGAETSASETVTPSSPRPTDDGGGVYNKRRVIQHTFLDRSGFFVLVTSNHLTGQRSIFY